MVDRHFSRGLIVDEFEVLGDIVRRAQRQVVFATVLDDDSSSLGQGLVQGLHL